MADHAKLAPSAADRWMVCPGSIALTDALPQKPGDDESTPDQQKGIDAHAWCEAVLLEEATPSDVPEEHADNVLGYVETVLRIREEMGPGTKMHIEKRLRHPKGLPDVWGTADVVLISKDKKEMAVVDYKNGRVPVVAKDNWQLTCYAVLAAGFFKVSPKKVHLVIVQPNAGDNLPAERSHSLKGKELKILEAQIRDAASLALSPEGMTIYRPGEKQCRWCPAAGQCTAQARSGAVADFFDGPPPTALLSDDQMSEMMHQLAEVDAFISALRKAAFQRAMEGNTLPGFKLVHKKTVRKWSDPVAVEQALRDKRIPVSTFLEPGKLKSFTKLEKDSRCGPIVKPFIIKPVGELQLALDSDPREEAQPGDDFAEELAENA
jgi:hypothetical protein